MLTKRLMRAAAVCLPLLCVVGCSGPAPDTGLVTPPEPVTNSRASGLSAPAAQVGRYRVTWAAPAGFSVADQAHGLAEVMARGKVSKAKFNANGAKFASTGQRLAKDDNWSERILESPPIHVKYHGRFNDLRVSNPELHAVYDASSTRSVTSEQAKEVFLKTFDELCARGLAERNGYDLGKLTTSTTEASVGRSDEPPDMVVVEYNFKLLRQLEGTDFANSGLSVSVHRSGAISRIRMGGATVVAGVGQAEKRALQSSAAARFSQSFPNVRVSDARAMYVMPDDKDDATIEPKYSFAFSRVTNVDGEQVISRKRRVFYSQVDPNAPVEDFTKENPSDRGDVR